MIVIESLRGGSVAEQSVEIVERKGKGHPDTICDSVMEAISLALSREYTKNFGAILHHNVDKGLLAAGRVNLSFGGGGVIKPMELYIGDRATFTAGGKKIPVAEIALEAAKKWLSANLSHVDPEKHMKYKVVLAPGSAELTDIFARRGGVMPANDTSAAVGFYPLSPTEDLVLKLERFLNSRQFKRRHPETGEDVKVMGLRKGSSLDITVAMPLLSRQVRSEREYFEKKEVVHAEMARFLREFDGFKNIHIGYNTLDEEGRGLSGVYLTLLGTSAEGADSGQVGRGNRVNGLISVNRPLGTEAAAGKNPVSHVGKIYNVLAHRIAKEIYERVEGVREVYLLLLSRIGTPIDRPQVANARILPMKGRGKGRSMREISREAEAIIEEELSRMKAFCRELSRGRYPVC